MRTKTRGVFLFCGLIFLFFSFKFTIHNSKKTKRIDRISYYRHLFNKSDIKFEMNPQRQSIQQLNSTTKSEQRRIVYLIQTQKCLSTKVLQEDHFGNPNLCHCDVIVFSFKEACSNSRFSHIEYLHGKNISWSKGRNILYRRSQEAIRRYLYYIFLDDDIEFHYHSAYTPSSMKFKSPLRAFEDFLLTYEPAVGVANYQTHHDADYMIRTIKELKCTPIDLKTLRIPIVHFDASFNAFHRDAVDHILPYPTSYDNICWWHSQRFVIAAAELMFRGHCVMFTPVVAINPSHGEYPRNDTDAKRIWSSIVKALSLHVPKENQNQTWIQEFINNPVEHTEKSQGLCMNIPPHHPIIPFSHFTFQRDV